MYAVVTSRRLNPSSQQETRERAEHEFWPTLQQAPGFVSFSLVQGEDEDGVTTAIVVFESQDHAKAFQGEADAWGRILDELGHQVESFARGEVVQHLTAST